MSMKTATNINMQVGCDRCAICEKCRNERPLLALLVFLKNGGKCDCFVHKAA